MKAVLQKLFLVSTLFSFIFCGCAATIPTPESSHDIEVNDSVAAGERIYFPQYCLSINKPPQEWEMQKDPGEGELVIWLNREAGAVIEIMVSRAVKNLSYHDIAADFKKSTCDLVRQKTPTVTCAILEEKEVDFAGKQFYRIRIAYQGIFRDFSVKSLVYLHKTDSVVYHFLFMEEKQTDLTSEMMHSVVIYTDPGKSGVPEKIAPPLSLVDAAYYGDMERVESLLHAGVDVNARNEDGVTALAYACDRGHTEIVKKLLAHDADVNTSSNIGSTALMNAAYMGQEKIVNILIASGADVNAQSKNGTTALMNAAAHGYKEVVEILLAHGAAADVCDECGLNALWNAISSGHCDVTEILISNGADVNASANDGTTVLMNAAFTGNGDMVKMLLAAGAEVNARADNGWTALLLAKRKGHAGIVRLLIEAGAMEDSPKVPGIFFKS